MGTSWEQLTQVRRNERTALSAPETLWGENFLIPKNVWLWTKMGYLCYDVINFVEITDFPSIC